MSKTLEEIIAKVAPDTLREALLAKRTEFEKYLAERVAAYTIEASNPALKGSDRRGALAAIEREIRKWEWAIEEVEKRLNESNEALIAPRNRAERRRAKDNGE